MGRKKREPVEQRGIKIYLFMVGREIVRVLTEKGKLVIDKEVGDVEEAQNFPRSKEFELALIQAIGDVEFHTEFVNDPGDHEGLIRACNILESPDGVDEPLTEIEAEIQVERKQTFVLTKDAVDGKKLEMLVEGDFMTTGFGCLKSGDVFRWYESDGVLFTSASGCCEFVAIDDIRNDSIEYEERENDIGGVVKVSEPQLKKVKTEEAIEIEIEETQSESLLKRAVMELESLKTELAGIQSDFNTRIKEQMKTMFQLARGKSKTHVDCRIENDWEGQKRNWYRKDTGELVKTENISLEEQQLNMNLPIPEQVEPEPIQEEIPVETSPGSEVEGTVEESVDGEPGEQVEDFPPPESEEVPVE